MTGSNDGSSEPRLFLFFSGQSKAERRRNLSRGNYSYHGPMCAHHPLLTYTDIAVKEQKVADTKGGTE